MKVIIARNSGFCDGVKRAMRIAIAAAGRPGGVAADGPLVHNRSALDLLALHGVADGDAGGGGTRMLVRAHGIPPEERRRWEEAGREIVDATCPRVANNQRLAREAAARGETVVLAGDRDHAEARAVAGSAGADCLIVPGPEDIENISPRGPVFLLAQTTFNVETFRQIALALRRRFPDSRVADSICRATHDRQEETAGLARRADVLVVVGGRNSANTRRLAEAGRAAGKPVFLVETADELVAGDFAPFRTAAVISGASTPGWITQEVVNRLRRLGRTGLSDQFLQILHTLVESRLSTALSAGGLALAAEFLLLREVVPALAVAGAGYVFFAHTLNRRIPPDPEARRLSLVDSFYQARRPHLLGLAWLAAAAGLGLAASEGAAVFALFLLAFLAASLYARAGHRRPLRPAESNPRPNPRNWAMAAGWALTLAGPPALEGRELFTGFGAVLAVFLVCFGGTLARDLHDIASDRLMGIDTLPARLGPPRARRLAGRALGLAAALPFFAALAAAWRGDGLDPWLAFVLLLPAAPGLGLYLLEELDKRRLPDAVLLQAGVDAMGVLAGVLAVAAYWLS